MLGQSNIDDMKKLTLLEMALVIAVIFNGAGIGAALAVGAYELCVGFAMCIVLGCICLYGIGFSKAKKHIDYVNKTL